LVCNSSSKLQCKKFAQLKPCMFTST
jgi:hypothetical protein